MLAQAGRHPVRAQRHRPVARQVSRARRLASKSGHRTRSSPTASSSGATRSSGCRSSTPCRGEAIDKLEQSVHLPGQALRAAGGADPQRGRRDPPRAARAARAVQVAGQAARGPAAQRPHAVRHRDDDGDGLLPGHRKLQPAAQRAGSRASRRTRCSISSRRITCCSSTSRTPPCRKSAPCTTATAAAKKRSSSTASACPARSTTGRCKFDEWTRADQAGGLRLGHAGPVRIGEDRRRSGRASRAADGPVGSRRSKLSRPAARCRICLEQIRERAAVGERVLVTTLTKRLAEDLADYFTERRRRCANGCTASWMPSSESSCCAICGKASSKRWWA